MIWLGALLLPLRLALAILYTLIFVITTYPLILLPRERWLALRCSLIIFWTRGNQLIFGFWVSVRNRPKLANLKGGVLFVGNHVSYWEAFTIAARIPKSYVAKAEIKDIPLIGDGAKVLGLLFVERSNMGSRVAMIETVKKALVRGERLMVFPEGTTESEPKLLPFNVGGFKASVDAAGEGKVIHIVPVGISYARFHLHAWGAQNGITHFLKSASLLWHHAALVFGEPIIVHAGDARDLCDQVREIVDGLFHEAQKITGP